VKVTGLPEDGEEGEKVKSVVNGAGEMVIVLVACAVAAFPSWTVTVTVYVPLVA